MSRLAAIAAAFAIASCGAGGSEPGPGDLQFDLATGSAVVVAFPRDIVYLGDDEVIDELGAVDRVGDLVALYEATPHPDLVEIVDAEANLPTTAIPFFRSLSYQEGIGRFVGTSDMVVGQLVLILERRSEFSRQGFDTLARVIVIDDVNAVLFSDWDDEIGAAQLTAIAAHLEETGGTWSQAIAALIDASRDVALDRPVDNPLGQNLLAVIAEAR